LRRGGEERFREDVIVWGDGALGAEGTPGLRGCSVGSVPAELAEKVGAWEGGP
jgi:hypothetical protein